MDLDPDLAALAPLGGFFVLRTGRAPGPLPTLARAYGPPPDRAGARTGEDPDVHDDPLTFRVRKVAGALRAAEPRVAASVAHQGLAARLWSAALGCAALYGRVPDLDAGLLGWDPDGSAPDDLWLAEVRPLPADAGTLARVVLDGHLEPLTAAVRARHRIAPALLWGNAASALAAAARLLERWARGSGDARAGAHARDLSARLLADPRLASAGTLTRGGFRRRSCCLYYRVPGGGVCGDCCFPRAPRSSPHAASGRS
ncbi:(2Fe-2S)-binding protein [Streptomyces sp. NPDC046831]|uniref:(2Fe-2S)-binding protein n=1 Tax=Streptomyces sp. NPDC046831 TaxID=3154805 RepID=UPI0033CAB07C